MRLPPSILSLILVKIYSGSKPKSMRLNCVKRLARSKNSPPKEIAAQKDLQLPQEGIQLVDHESFIASS